MKKYKTFLILFLLASMIVLPECYTKILVPKSEVKSSQSPESEQYMLNYDNAYRNYQFADPEISMYEMNYRNWLYYQYRDFLNNRLWTDYRLTNSYYDYNPYWNSPWSDYYYHSSPYSAYGNGYYNPYYGYSGYGYSWIGSSSSNSSGKAHSSVSEKKQARIQGRRYRKLKNSPLANPQNIQSLPLIASPSQSSTSSGELQKGKGDSQSSTSKKKEKKSRTFDSSSRPSSLSTPSASKSHRSSSSSGSSSRSSSSNRSSSSKSSKSSSSSSSKRSRK